MRNNIIRLLLIILISSLLLVGISILPLLHNHPPYIFSHSNCPVSVVENVFSGSNIATPINILFQDPVPELLSGFDAPQVLLNCEYSFSPNRAPPVI